MSTSQEIQDSFDESLDLNSQGRNSCALKRHLESNSPGSHKKSYCVKRACNGIAPGPSSEAESSPLAKFSGFLTAGSNREIKVSETALVLARARLRSSVEDTCIEEKVLDSASSAPAQHLGFVTAGSNKAIHVSEAALELARRRLDSVPDVQLPTSGRVADEENLDPSVGTLLRRNSTYKRAVMLSGTPTTTRNPKNLINTSSSTPNMVKPNAGTTTSVPPLAGVSCAALSAFSCRVTCVRDLSNLMSPSVDFLGIVIKGGGPGEHSSEGVSVIELGDRYGESVSVELISSSIPPSISRGSVISIAGALVKRVEGAISLVSNDSSFVDFEPIDPEAQCLHRLFETGLFNEPPAEDLFFDSTSLRMIGRLNEYPGETSTIMARILGINLDKLVYLGCTVCKSSVSPNPKGAIDCQHCRNRKARYFYSLSVELADFSGIIDVILSTDAAEKLVGRPAGAMVRLNKQSLQSTLASLCYRPMLFRISMQNSKWFVDEWIHLDIPKFKPYLKKIAESKGYK
ncbi:hypothetical protein RB195_009713 [Necator americanus]|uniref:Replication factor A C-terminal domain-containing protein n=1 Tax=Necator americanus TaxID=51031 RepID=A0ABR1CUK9_NECAM